MNTVKPTTKPAQQVKLSFCACGEQFQVETRSQKSCPSCIEARAIAEANKPPTVCRHCGEARNDCRFRICVECREVKRQAEEAKKAAKPAKKCKTCGEMSDYTFRGVCSPCSQAAHEQRREEAKQERLAQLRAEREQRDQEEPAETDPTLLRAYAALERITYAIALRRQEIAEEVEAAAALVPLEDQPHVDQAAIDAAFGDLMADLDI